MKKLFSPLLAVLAALMLSGCDWVVINPSGYIAKQQSNLLIFSVVVMLLIIVPVMFFTLFYAWKYRASNAKADYDPDFHHSNKLEAMIWGVPILIIIVLATVTWGSTHLLDPYQPLTRVDSQTRVAGAEENFGAVKRLTNAVLDPSRSDGATTDAKPLVVEVTALDWKWLFIYPEQGIATVNELAAPVNVPIEFRLTSASMMNSFYIPALAGQVYAMPGMQTRLHAAINDEGVFKGFSANYTGHGFSQMHFNFHGLSAAGFDAWVEQVRGTAKTLNRAEYIALDQFDQKDAKGHVRYFGTRRYGTVEPELYQAILNMCVYPGAMCMAEMMQTDLAGGAGIDSQDNAKRLRYDRRRTLKAQLDLAEFADVTSSFVCTTDTADADARVVENPAARLPAAAADVAKRPQIQALRTGAASLL